MVLKYGDMKIWNLLNQFIWNFVKEYSKLERPLLVLWFWENLQEKTFWTWLKLNSILYKWMSLYEKKPKQSAHLQMD